MREVALGFGTSGDMVLCVRSAQTIRCLPTTLNPQRTELPPVTRAGPPLIVRALAGNSGAGFATDYRGEWVIAAHGPVGDLGLGLVLKVDVAEVYAPIRKRFELTLLLILLIVGVGILLLRARLVPLVRRLALSEQRWQFALEGARDGVWDWNLVTNEVFFSPQWKRMLGYEDHEIPGALSEWDKRVHPDDKAGAYADIGKHLKGETPYYQNEHRLQCKDGTYKWILDRGMIVSRDANGKPTRMIGTHTDITEHKQAEATIHELSLVDDLTGLRNRRGFFVLGESQLNLARRLDRSVVLYFADVDGLKQINDELGHIEGDRALTDVADILRAVFRETDVIARLGGDEFVVLALEAPEVGTAAARFEEQLKQFNRNAQRPYRLAVSLGVARHATESSESLTALLGRADAGMYQVKLQRRAGR
jgi:diguanylate cyclase (GGDEF)-like protein/PAS domain S-box-containing protein